MLSATDCIPMTELDLEIFAATVPKDHCLRRVKEIIDFDAFRDRLATAYHASLGRPAKEPLLLLRLEFLQYYYGLSDREVVERARGDMAFRFFLNLSLHSPLPDPSLLSYFRTRLGPEVHQQIFDDLVAQARERGLVKDRVRLKDATHVIANIAIPSTLALVAQTRDELLKRACPYNPERVAGERIEAERVRIMTADLPDPIRLAHRVAHLRAVVAWVDDLMLRLPQNGSPEDQTVQRLREALALAHKVLHDRDDPKAPDKVVSTVDRDARTGWHHQYYTGYSLDIAVDADSELITAIDVLPANGDEAANAAALIEHEEQVHGNDVETLSIDGIGFRGDLLEQWADPNGLNLEVIVPPTEQAPAGGYPPERFVVDEAGRELTCPAGQTTHQRERNSKDTGWKYRFSPQQCQGCPLRQECLAKPETTRARRVTKNDHEATYRAAQEKATTPRYGEVRKQHPRVERKLGELARWHDARRARYRGRAKVRVQALITALVVNVKRMLKLLEAGVAVSEGTVRAECTGV